MSVVLNDILTLVGRLDDGPGVDTPRERFRRFLVELNDLSVVRSIIEQAERALGEQQHRALQDAVVRLGRFLGFETTFGLYARGPGMATPDGQWRSRHRLEIVLDLRTNQTSTSSVEELARSVAALTAVRHDDRDVQSIGLLVVTPMYPNRARLEEAAIAAKAHAPLRIASIHSLLWLAQVASDGKLSHDEIVQLLTSDVSPDFAVDLLERFAAQSAHDEARAAADMEPPAPPPIPVRIGPAYWVATIGSDETATPEQFVESVVRGREVLGVGDDEAALEARVDDWLCFSLGRQEIVGRARVASIGEGAGLLRGAHRFRSVFRLKDVEIYEAPVAVGREALLDHLAAITPMSDAGPRLVPVSRQDFDELTGSTFDSRPEDLHRAV